MSDKYAPFPEQELAALAAYHEQIAAAEIKSKGHETWLAGLHSDRAKACRDALACHDALRTRFLELRAGLRTADAA